MTCLRRLTAPASTRHMFKSKVVAWCLLLLMVLQGAALAQPDWLTQFDPGETYGEQMPWVQPLSSTNNLSSASSSGGSSGLDIGSLHKYLGWGTLLLACVTAVTGSDSSLHHNSALAATAFGLGTAATGYYEYSDYFETVKADARENEIEDVFSGLIDQKIAHKESLFQLFRKIAGPAADQRFPTKILPKPPHDVMAGCVSVPEAVDWSRDKKISDILDLLMALEANTLDLYLKLGRQVASERARTVFVKLSEEEVRHLEQLGSIFEKTL